jgi:hypothetical protein
MAKSDYAPRVNAHRATKGAVKRRLLVRVSKDYLTNWKVHHAQSRAIRAALADVHASPRDKQRPSVSLSFFTLCAPGITTKRDALGQESSQGLKH